VAVNRDKPRRNIADMSWPGIPPVISANTSPAGRNEKSCRNITASCRSDATSSADRTISGAAGRFISYTGTWPCIQRVPGIGA